MESERDWYWCSECEKAYQETDDGQCPYCGAETAVDGWWWPKLRRTNPQLPETPVEGDEYFPDI